MYSCRKPTAPKGKKKREQQYEPSRPEGSWQTICGLKDLKALAKRFSKATNRQEKALHLYLKEEVLPPLEEAEAARIMKKKKEEQERKRKAELDAMPRKVLVVCRGVVFCAWSKSLIVFGISRDLHVLQKHML